MAAAGTSDTQPGWGSSPTCVRHAEGRACFNLNVGLGAFTVGRGARGLRLAVAMQRSVDPEVADFTAERVRAGELVPVEPSRGMWLRSVWPSGRMLFYALRDSSSEK